MSLTWYDIYMANLKLKAKGYNAQPVFYDLSVVDEAYVSVILLRFLRCL